MDSATLTLDGLRQSKNRAFPHSSKGYPIDAVKPTYYRLPAAAGVNSSILDLAKWMQAQFGTEPGLPVSVIESVTAPRIKTPWEEEKMRRNYGALSNSSYALGWRVYEMSGRRVIGHRGAVEGYRAHILFDPVAQTGVAVMWNSSAYRPSGLALEIFDQVDKKPRRDWMRLGPIYTEKG